MENFLDFNLKKGNAFGNISIIYQKNSNVNIQLIETLQNVEVSNVTAALLNQTINSIPESESADKKGFHMAVQLLFLSIVSLIALWYPLKLWWKKRNIRLGNDPSSPLSHLPLPPGDFGLPLIGETFAWITQVS